MKLNFPTCFSDEVINTVLLNQEASMDGFFDFIYNVFNKFGMIGGGYQTE